MNCPHTERVIELTLDGRLDTESAAHARSCAACSAELFLAREIHASFSPEFSVPDALVERAVETVLEETALPPLRGAGDPVAIFAATVLGAATTLVTVVGTGSLGEAGMSRLVAFCVLGGVLALTFEWKALRTSVGAHAQG